MTNDRRGRETDEAVAGAIKDGRLIPYMIDEEYPVPRAMPGPGAFTQAEIDEMWRDRDDVH